MADLILKQWVSVIDRRTTIICLHAAGQIRSVLEPFDTLNGQMDMPPAHVHCRAIAVPWMAGFVNVQRQDANAELQNRPLKQRRIGPGGVLAVKLPPAALPGTTVPIPVVIPIEEIQAQDDPDASV